MTVLFVFLAFTIIMGIILYVNVRANKPRQDFVVALHGIFAGISLGALTYAGADYIGQSNLLFNFSFMLFWIGGFLGVFMLMKDKLFSKGIPTWLAGFPAGKGGIPKMLPLVHAGIQLVALVLLILFVIQSGL
mgnify:CR=1 FL=1